MCEEIKSIDCFCLRKANRTLFLPYTRRIRIIIYIFEIASRQHSNPPDHRKNTLQTFAYSFLFWIFTARINIFKPSSQATKIIATDNPVRLKYRTKHIVNNKCKAHGWYPFFISLMRVLEIESIRVCMTGRCASILWLNKHLYIAHSLRTASANVNTDQSRVRLAAVVSEVVRVHVLPLYIMYTTHHFNICFTKLSIQYHNIFSHDVINWYATLSVYAPSRTREMAGTIPDGVRSSSVTGQHKHVQDDAQQHAEAAAQLAIRAGEHAQPGESGLLLARRRQRHRQPPVGRPAVQRWVPAGAVPLPLGLLGRQRLRAYRRWRLVFGRTASGALESHQVCVHRWGGLPPGRIGGVGRVLAGEMIEIMDVDCAVWEMRNKKRTITDETYSYIHAFMAKIVSTW